MAAWDRFWFLQFAVRSCVLVASGDQDTPDVLVEVAFLMPAFLCFLENSKMCPHLSLSPNAFSSFPLHACDLELPKDTTAGPGHSRAFFQILLLPIRVECSREPENEPQLPHFPAMSACWGYSRSRCLCFLLCKLFSSWDCCGKMHQILHTEPGT